ncbi:hypothetical protein ACIA59_17400 [Micromonospora haikouensis]|uniref:hypothetical protein n=1 Tax=Micromonospora haikouensis TaxID=686309 RepID=UPI00378CAF45
MSNHLTDEQLRAAALSRPGYATYPQYRPGQPERLGQLPPVNPPAPPAAAGGPGPVDAPTPPPATTGAPHAAGRPAAGPAPISEPFVFRPARAPGRPWWRRGWQWAVVDSSGAVAYGDTWTETGAYWRSARQARRSTLYAAGDAIDGRLLTEETHDA